MEWELYLPDETATEQLGEQVADELLPGDLVLLSGPLGAGKTTLVRGLVRHLGGNPAEVCSPTFVLQESYRLSGGRGIQVLHHLDLYRLRGRDWTAFAELGLVELLEEPGAVMAVEWAEKLPERGLAPRVLHVALAWEGDGRHARLRWLVSA